MVELRLVEKAYSRHQTDDAPEVCFWHMSDIG